MRRLVLLLVLLLHAPAALNAQVTAEGAGPRRQPVFASAPVPAALADTAMRIRPTHWVTGAAIGGTGLGLLTAVLAVGFCGMNGDAGGGPTTVGCAAGGFLGGALLGATIGALIGGQFPKGEPWQQPGVPAP